jgi:hypothetical protein
VAAKTKGVNAGNKLVTTRDLTGLMEQMLRIMATELKHTHARLEALERRLLVNRARRCWRWIRGIAQ